eukprot:gene8057-8920_t
MKLKNSQFRNSSAINSNHTATDARLNIGKGWCVSNDSNPALSIDFGKLVTITKIATQGAYFEQQLYHAFKYSIKLSYTRTRWHNYKEDNLPKEFYASDDANATVVNAVNNVMTRYIQLLPQYPEAKNILCLRLEIYGCYAGSPPNVNVHTRHLKLTNSQTGSAICNATGQVDMNVQLIKPANDTMVSDSGVAKNTRGIFHNESRSILFASPSSMITFDKSCMLDTMTSQLTCKRNYSCKASYLFSQELSNSRTIQVDFRKDVTIDMHINQGQLSPVKVNIKKQATLTCQARANAPTQLVWTNRVNRSWAENTDHSSGSIREGMLNYVHKKSVYVQPTARDVINMLNCTVNGDIVCRTWFICSANYIFNSSIRAAQSKEVDFLLEDPMNNGNICPLIAALPGTPDAPNEECQSYKCTVSWSAPSNPGDVDNSNIHYRVTILELSKSVSTNAMTYDFSNLNPNTKYTVELRTQIKRKSGQVLWESQPVKREFSTRPLAPIEAPKLSKILTTVDSVYIQWKPVQLAAEFGELLKFDLELRQQSYGGLSISKIIDLQQIIRIVNVDKSRTSFTFTGLKPWSMYEVSIKFVNTHLQSSKAHSQIVSTDEAAPSSTPRDISGWVIHATSIELRWTEPPFEDRNGNITHYIIKWRSQAKRVSRETLTEMTVTKSSIQFNCPPCKFVVGGLRPYKQYVFRIAAVTKGGIGNFSSPQILRTAQTAPSAPVSLSYRENKTTFYLTWKQPAILNGILKEYEIKIRKNGRIVTIFTESTATFYDTKLNDTDTLLFKIRAYTQYLHNKGGLAGKWSDWVVAKRKLPPVTKPTTPDPKKHSDPTTAIIISFVVVLILLLIFIAVIFILYRRKERRRLRGDKMEVEMDSVVDDGEDEDINIVPSERLPLTKHLGSQETVDVPEEDHAHRPIPLDEFAAYVNGMRENDDDLFYNEYKNQLISGKCHPTEIADREGNKPKNRYTNITAYDHSRVILKPEVGKKSSHHHHHNREGDYFNANFIEGYFHSTKYIASQGPTESVVSDFWRMVWQQKSNVIVMLTNLEEGEKVKCHQYWPSAGAMKYGQVTVRFHSSDQTADYLVRTFEIEKVVQKGKEKRFVTQFHFVSWPDHGVPEFPTAILSLRRRVRHYYNGHAPMIVHCSAGVGRTGCFILIDAMLERIDNDEGTVDIFNYLQYMRTRRINMVQTLDQYIFAHTAVLEYIIFGNTEISVIDLESRLKELEKHQGIETEFKLIESTADNQNSDDNVYRVLLNNGKFIDVFYVDGYKQRDAFFISQSPSQNLAPDFWKMLIERECHTIVMLNRLEEENIFKYWPGLNRNETYGDFTVHHNAEVQSGNIVTRKFKISQARGSGEDYEVQHFQFLDWPSNDVPVNRSSILTLMSLIEKSQQNFGNAPVLVHSGHGAGRSGTFISIYNSTERLKVEQLIDVVQCVRAIRTAVPNAVDTVEQYRFIYNMIRTYLEAFETYANFHDPTPQYEIVSLNT